MSTDDSISEDVSSSVALSTDHHVPTDHHHHHHHANRSKGSEASIVSSEDTASGPVGTEDERPVERERPVQTLEGLLQVAEETSRSRAAGSLPHRIRGLCPETEELGSDRPLPFINPSSLETLRVLVQEIQSSGQTDPEVWKNCEGRWLHLFQLVEKQYQEQILAQQEQYQCQIQLIQDEIKALLQLQQKQSVEQKAGQAAATQQGANAKLGADSGSLQNGRGSSPSAPPQAASAGESSEEGAVSGYGTLSTWEVELEAESHLLPSPLADSCLANQQHQQRPASTPIGHTHQHVPCRQALTSWAQRHQRSQKRGDRRSRHSPPPAQEKSEAGAMGRTPPADHQEQPGCPADSSSPSSLKRSDSLVSEASGLTYWRLDESELYRPLPDSFCSTSPLPLQGMTTGPDRSPNATLWPDQCQTPPPERTLSVSLKEIYQTRKSGEFKCRDWDPLAGPSSTPPQVLTLDSVVGLKQPKVTPEGTSERTSGLASPSPLSSPHGPWHLHPDPDPAHQDAASQGAEEGGGACSEDEGRHTSSTTPTSTLHTQKSAFRLSSAPRTSPALSCATKLERTASLEDPVTLSLMRQNLREKHARHVADLRAYYESEIASLKEKLDLTHLPRDVEKSNQILQGRCNHLDRALSEASRRIRELEEQNQQLEKQLREWPERYEVASSAVKAVQQRLEESHRTNREKDVLVTKLRTRLRQLEVAAQNACKEREGEEAHRKQEHKMLLDLLTEYESLRKEHDGAKDKLFSTENKLFEATEQISELKRVISKLESQVKQLEHESQAKLRMASHAHTQSTGLFHHPDLLMSPSRRYHEVDGGMRKSPVLQADQASSQAPDKTGVSDKRRVSLPVWELQHDSTSQTHTTGRRDAALTPVMRALIELEGTKATEGKALSKTNRGSTRSGRSRPTVGFVDSSLCQSMYTRGGASAKPDAEPMGVADVAAAAEQRGGSAHRGGGAFLRAQRSLSPEGHRSSSLPPRTQRPLPVATPSRNTLITPLSAKSSPKRSPTENISTAFSNPTSRFKSDQRGLGSSPLKGSPRKRLHYSAPERTEDDQQAGPGLGDSAGSEGCEDQEAEGSEVADTESCVLELPDEVPLSYQSRLQSLADAERLLDDLTQEKQQIEAALSRMPGAGGRVTLQTRLDEVTLENRLEQVNRDLGSLRMTLKRYNILRSSTHT
ncbi:M-phase phosphoprotein 9 isoform X2 [Alosa pseudoharengus]|uniref:M-phase phosphoprotein 9 isoform X2 n=1 Tax=Alosa pseudoharengus TaxID=34774 RepID=UPI003F8BBF51